MLTRDSHSEIISGETRIKAVETKSRQKKGQPTQKATRKASRHRKRDSRTARDFSNKENMHSLLNIVEVDAKTPKDANSEVYKGSVHRSTLGLEKSQDGSIRKSIPQIFFENAALNILNTNFTVSTDNIEHEKLLKNVQIRKKSKERKPLGVLHPKSQSKVSSIVVKNSVCKPNKSLKCK